jgi:hypothetical protein
MALNARRRPLVTDGASGIDPLHGKIRRPNNRNRSGLQAIRHVKTAKLIEEAAGAGAPRLEVYTEITLISTKRLGRRQATAGAPFLITAAQPRGVGIVLEK